MSAALIPVLEKSSIYRAAGVRQLARFRGWEHISVTVSSESSLWIDAGIVVAGDVPAEVVPQEKREKRAGGGLGAGFSQEEGTLGHPYMEGAILKRSIRATVPGATGHWKDLDHEGMCSLTKQTTPKATRYHISIARPTQDPCFYFRSSNRPSISTTLLTSSLASTLLPARPQLLPSTGQVFVRNLRSTEKLLKRSVTNTLSATYSKVTDLSARVAAAVGGATAQTEGWAVSLDVSKTLAVVALLACCIDLVVYQRGWTYSISGSLTLCRAEDSPYHQSYEDNAYIGSRNASLPMLQYAAIDLHF
ncbi:hypothetical protein M8818_003305 [Zalaria obscura]|uniref:Uncharacterized protein n=1 Tax=Zalaria obscura TaxID=2024903 RepID=A0ACC3SJ68_9PEZI